MKKYLVYIAVFLSAGMFSSCLKENVNNSIGELNSMASIYVVRSVYKNVDVPLGKGVLGGAYKTSGIVIANTASGNFPSGLVVIQDEWRGLMRGITLVLDQSTAAGLNIGDSVVVDLEGTTLARYNGGPLSVVGLSSGAVKKAGENKPVVARPVNTTELKKNPGNYENTLVSVTADVTPFPANEPLEGKKMLADGGDESLPLFTEATADFASDNIAPSATFLGVYLNIGGEYQLRMRTLGDMQNPSGPIYAGYPEDFESPDAAQKASYAGKDIDLKTGNWRLEQCLLGVTAGRDRIVSGSQAIRFQQNLGTSSPSFLRMNYDLTNGATKVTFWYGCYYTDAASSFVLEASTDQGTSWNQIGNVISDPEKTSTTITPKQATFTMDIEGNVRFRIRKLPLGPTAIPTVENGRLGIDDIAIYQQY